MTKQLVKANWLIGLMVFGLATVVQAQDSTRVASAGSAVMYGRLAMILSLLALIGVVLLWRRTMNAPASARDTARSPDVNQSVINELSGRIKTLEQERNQTKKRLDVLESSLEQLRQRATAPQNQFRESQPVRNEPIPDVPSRTSAAPPQPQPVPEPAPAPAVSQSQSRTRTAPAPAMPSRLFARTADVPGGFSVGSLTESPSRPMVFIITPTAPMQATFRVSDDPEAQRLALSDPYSYLSEACQYNSRPEPNSRIVTVSEGRLSLQGEIWVIVQKAEISFTA
ncbi:hypothetical protein BN8_03324 [Fibrisoma limi BUZ 3]|uniref:Uncharacterized protein n=1 Tax=Fibrisoma limi BUZ 3 TaxID=1185876 RepID=I2GJV4_9BACT|nr:hypothetical protein [Fibrisoma limi]CCH54179.1 hypothetical protein BN8_03324 [Fibrisoma limi BUZ 3]